MAHISTHYFVPYACFKVVVAVEHLDGSANMACYTDHNGKIKWLQNSHSGIPDAKVNMDIRIKQLQQV